MLDQIVLQSTIPLEKPPILKVNKVKMTNNNKNEVRQHALEGRAHAIRLALLSDPDIASGIYGGYMDERAGQTISLAELARRYNLRDLGVEESAP